MWNRAHLASLLFLAAFSLFAQSKSPASSQVTNINPSATDSKTVPKGPTPTVFQSDQGDRWMLLGDKPLVFKVDPLSTGSDTLVVGTEEMSPGNRIPTHKHLYEDEVIFVHKGAVRVTLAGGQYDAETGATVFIPHGNWIGVENASGESATILFFSISPHSSSVCEPCRHVQARNSPCLRQRS